MIVSQRNSLYKTGSNETVINKWVDIDLYYVLTCVID